MSLKRALAEEAELEKELFAQDDEPTEKEAVTIPNVDTFELDEDDSGEQEPTESKEQTQEIKEEDATKKQRSSWKQRYIGFKASADKTIYNLRKENQTFVNQILELRKNIDTLSLKIAELQARDKDPFKEVITDEDVETIGIEAVDIVKKATKKATEAATAPLQAELEKIKARELERIKKEAEDRRIREYNSFIVKLREMVPDFEAINLDPGFEAFMKQKDDYFGETRIELFRKAEDYLDAERVADFFKLYKANAPRSKKDMLEDKISIDAKTSSPAPEVKREETFSMKEVSKFFDDVNKGVYRGRQKEASELEARITKAYVEGRITE